MFTRDVKIFMFVIFARHTKRGASQRKLKVLHDSAFNCHSKNMFQHIFESQRHAINNKSEPPLISGEKHKMQNSFEIYLSTARRPADIVQKTPFFHHHENLLMNFFTLLARERNEKEMKKRSFDEEKRYINLLQVEHSMHFDVSMKHLLYASLRSIEKSIFEIFLSSILSEL